MSNFLPEFGQNHAIRRLVAPQNAGATSTLQSRISLEWGTGRRHAPTDVPRWSVSADFGRSLATRVGIGYAR